MTKNEILWRVMTFATLNELYNGYCAKLLAMLSNEKVEVTLISKEEIDQIIDFLCTNYDEDEYHFEDSYDMRTRQNENLYITADLQISEFEYENINTKTFQIVTVDDDNYELTFYTQKNHDSVLTLMPICFEEFYEYCEEVLNKKERELNKEIKKEFPKDEETATKNEETVTKIETNYRKVAEKFLENYEFIINSYEFLSKVVNDEQLIDVFEMIFKNFGE